MENHKKTLNFNVWTFVDILKKDKRKFAMWICGFGLFGVIVAFSIPKEYSTTVTLAPEISGNSMLSSVSSLASMVGLYNDANPTGDAIYPEIYPDLMSSTDFLVSLFDIKVVSKDGTISTTYYKYLKNDQKHTWWSYPFIAFPTNSSANPSPYISAVSISVMLFSIPIFILLISSCSLDLSSPKNHVPCPNFGINAPSFNLTNLSILVPPYQLLTLNISLIYNLKLHSILNYISF